MCEYPSDSRSSQTADEERSAARQPAAWSVIDSVLSDPPASEGELTEVMKYCECIPIAEPSSDLADARDLPSFFPYFPLSKNDPFVSALAALAWKDPLLNRIALLFCVFRAEYDQTPREQVRTKQLAGECVKLLQDRFNFERGDCSGTSDETLLAVAALAVFEVSVPSDF